LRRARQTRRTGARRRRSVEKNRGTPDPLPARLLATEETAVLDHTCTPRPLVVTRHTIAHDLTALLTRGLTTTSAGGFFFLPSLLPLGAYDLTASWGPAKRADLPPERLALGLVFASIFGYPAGIRAVETVSRAACGLLAGLPVRPSPSPQYRFLQDVPVQDSLDVQTALGQRLVARGQGTPGPRVKVDGPHSTPASRKAMPDAFRTQEDRSGKAMRPFSTPDQPSQHPLIALATSAGTTVSQVTRRLARLTRDILGRDGLLVADKAWDGGPRLQERLTPVWRHGVDPWQAFAPTPGGRRRGPPGPG
jgi:hypothetical protein